MAREGKGRPIKSPGWVFRQVFPSYVCNPCSGGSALFLHTAIR